MFGWLEEDKYYNNMFEAFKKGMDSKMKPDGYSTNKTRYDKMVYDKKSSLVVSPETYFTYKKIIFSPPATIVIWYDDEKTVVKCSENDTFDFEKGLALCFMKRALGNKSGRFNKILKKGTEGGRING